MLLLVGAWSQLSGCADESNADAAARADAENGRLLLIGGERIDTASQHGVAPLKRRSGHDVSTLLLEPYTLIPKPNP